MKNQDTVLKEKNVIIRKRKMITKIIDGTKRTVFEIGYMGEGPYNSSCEYYTIWYHMMERGYSKKYRENYSSYIGCSVDDNWHNFQIFAKWCDINNFHKDWQIDKDILMKWNKIYGPDTCCFVPGEINQLFVKQKIQRNPLHPQGVYLNNGYYLSNITLNQKRKFLGCFKTIEKAFETYKFHKEKSIRWLALKYKGQITERVFNAMMNYNVEITD